MTQRIVCAANRLGETGVVILGARHWDSWMHKQFNQSAIPERHIKHCVQGFIDNLGNFLTRTEAWKIAEAVG